MDNFLLPDIDVSIGAEIKVKNTTLSDLVVFSGLDEADIDVVGNDTITIPPGAFCMFINTGVMWISALCAPAVGASTTQLTVITVNTTVLATDGKYLVDASAGPVTITLPVSLDGKGKDIYIKKTDSSVNAVTILADDTLPNLIDGQASIDLTVQYQSVLLNSDNTSWYLF